MLCSIFISIRSGQKRNIASISRLVLPNPQSWQRSKELTWPCGWWIILYTVSIIRQNETSQAFQYNIAITMADVRTNYILNAPQFGSSHIQTRIHTYIIRMRVGLIDSSSKWEFGEPSSNSSRVCYINFRANTFGKRMKPYRLPLYMDK